MHYFVSKKQPCYRIKLNINSMVSKLLTFIPGRLNPWIIESTHGLKQDDQSFIRTVYRFERKKVTSNKSLRLIANLLLRIFGGNITWLNVRMLGIECWWLNVRMLVIECSNVGDWMFECWWLNVLMLVIECSNVGYWMFEYWWFNVRMLVIECSNFGDWMF